MHASTPGEMLLLLLAAIGSSSATPLAPLLLIKEDGRGGRGGTSLFHVDCSCDFCWALLAQGKHPCPPNWSSQLQRPLPRFIKKRALIRGKLAGRGPDCYKISSITGRGSFGRDPCSSEVSSASSSSSFSLPGCCPIRVKGQTSFH